MNRMTSWTVGLLAIGMLMGGGCSRARVQSMTKMNEGVVLAQQKRHVDAIKALESAAAIDPQNDQAYWNLTIVHMELRKFGRARDDLQRAISLAPDKAGYQEKLGTILIELEDWNGAKQALEKSIELEPSLFKAYYKLAQVLERLDDQQGALQRYSEAVQKGPRFLEAYSALGRLYADLGYLDHASQVLTQALQVALPRTFEEATAHHLLGTVYQQQRKYDDAVREFRAALDVVPGMRDALFSLGWTYDGMGNKEEAKRYLRKYVELAGTEAPAHYVKAAQDRLSEIVEGF